MIEQPFLDLKAENSVFINELNEAATRVIASGRYIGGQEVTALEQDLCQLLKAPHAVGVASGLDALHLALRAAIACGLLRKGDKVMVPANTYIASFLAVTHAGLTPQPLDPDEASMVLTGRIVRENLTPQTKALMPVHLYGLTAWDQEMADVCRENNLLVIEDAAQSIGAKASCPGLFTSAFSGAIGHIGALSFYPTKNIGALGDAGAVITNLPEIAQTVRALANYGSAARYHNVHLGFNSRLDPIQAAFLRVKLKHLHSLNSQRFNNVIAYHNTITNPSVTKPEIHPNLTDNVWHQYVIRTTRRNELRRFLAENGVDTDIHYPVPPHLQPCYKSKFGGMNFPIAEKISRTALSLPIAPGTVSVKNAAEIGKIINRFE